MVKRNSSNYFLFVTLLLMIYSIINTIYAKQLYTDPPNTMGSHTAITNTCMANWSELNRQITIPCISVPGAFGVPQIYNLGLKQKTNSLDFEVDINTLALKSNISNSCMARYSSSTGRVVIPCISIPGIFGISQVYTVELKKQSGSLIFEVDISTLIPSQNYSIDCNDPNLGKAEQAACIGLI